MNPKSRVRSVPRPLRLYPKSRIESVLGALRMDLGSNKEQKVKKVD